MAPYCTASRQILKVAQRGPGFPLQRGIMGDLGIQSRTFLPAAPIQRRLT